MHIPINLVLRGRNVVVIGGGERAAKTAVRLVNLGAAVVVISASPLEALENMEKAGKLSLERRVWSEADISNAIVFAACEDDGANFDVAESGRKNGALVSVHQHPEAGDFHLPAIVEIGGGLRISVDTEGDVPEFEHELHTYLHAVVDPGWGRGSRVIGALRLALADNGTAAERSKFWHTLTAELPQAGHGDFEELRAWIERARDASGITLRAHEITALLKLV